MHRVLVATLAECWLRLWSPLSRVRLTPTDGSDRLAGSEESEALAAT
jgi:hypothetical protein